MLNLTILSGSACASTQPWTELKTASLWLAVKTKQLCQQEVTDSIWVRSKIPTYLFVWGGGLDTRWERFPTALPAGVDSLSSGMQQMPTAFLDGFYGLEWELTADPPEMYLGGVGSERNFKSFSWHIAQKSRRKKEWKNQDITSYTRSCTRGSDILFKSRHIPRIRKQQPSEK